jgi:hypothetical protein
VDKRCPNHVVSPIHVEFKSVSEPEDSNILYIHRKPIRYTLFNDSDLMSNIHLELTGIVQCTQTAPSWVGPLPLGLVCSLSPLGFYPGGLGRL